MADKTLDLPVALLVYVFSEYNIQIMKTDIFNKLSNVFAGTKNNDVTILCYSYRRSRFCSEHYYTHL